MLQKNIGEYFIFGLSVRYLQDASINYRIGSEKEPHVRANLHYFFKYLKESDLHVTLRAANELEEFYNTLIERDNEATLTVEEAIKLASLMTDLQKTLLAEIQGYNAYIPTPKRLDVIKLIDKVPELLPPGVFNKLSRVAQYDIKEAGKCIAFERPTAAAFHLVRCVEGVLREFYCELVRQKRVRPLMWGAIVNDLRKRKKGKPHQDLLNHLDHIRASLRNPTQHPERIYDIEEVQELWGLCIDAITRMSEELPEPLPESPTISGLLGAMISSLQTTSSAKPLKPIPRSKSPKTEDKK